MTPVALYPLLSEAMGCNLACAALPVAETDAGAAGIYDKWLAAGMHAGMDYMARHRQLRISPEGLLPGSQTMICCAIAFPIRSKRPQSLPVIANYALGADYHDAIRKRLKTLLKRLSGETRSQWRLCIDSAPVMERYWAVKSGIGHYTKSGMVRVEGFGTACFLFEILTTLPPERIDCTVAEGYDWATGGKAQCDGCGRCTRACPTGALGADGRIDSRKCLSYLTIEHSGPWTDTTAMEAMASPGGRNTLFGCDRCVTACPLNKDLHPSFMPELLPRRGMESFTARDALALEQEAFLGIFKGSPLKRCRLEGLRRNAANCINAHNEDQ